MFGLEISCAKVKQTAAGGCLAIPVDGHISQISLAINSDNKQIASGVAGTCLDCCCVAISVDEVACDIQFARYISCPVHNASIFHSLHYKIGIERKVDV